MCSHRQEERRVWERLGLPLPINDGIEPKETARRETQGAHSWSTGVVVVGGGQTSQGKVLPRGGGGARLSYK